MKTILFMLCAAALQAQVSDDFSDGDFKRNPQWIGDTSKFRVSNQRLQLNAPPVSGQAGLVFVNRVISSARWEFEVELGFNPSSSNFARFYLVSDTLNLTGDVHGYYVQIGSTADDISFYRQDGSVRKILIDGADGRLNFSLVRVRIVIETDEDGIWKLQSDVGITGTWVTEGSVQDITYTTNNFSGWYCQYTSTRSDKFFLDNVRTSGSLFPDRIPPRIISASLTDSATLMIGFSEAMLSTTLTDRTMYAPLPASTTVIDDWHVRLGLSPSLSNGQLLTQRIAGLRDRAGNIMRDTILTLPWVVPRLASFRSVIFNEIMADPSPPMELPESEYLELYNRSGVPFNLEGWQLTDGSSKAVLPRSILLPGQYITVWPSTFSGSLPGIWAKGFPSLNNSGDELKLLDPLGRVIDSVNYESSWHTVSGKAEGGWSLELIDPRNECQNADNWASSVDPTGGTPGRENSVLASKPDLTGVAIHSAAVVDSAGVRLMLSESVLPESLITATFSITPKIGLLTAQLEADGKELMMRFADTLCTGKFYSVLISGLRDCPGNDMPDDGRTIRFLRPHQPDSADVVINEIMFDPFPGEGDYVEIWNRTSKYFQLNDWRVARAAGDSIYGYQHLGSFLLAPHQYAVLTQDHEMMKAAWPTLPDSLICEVTMPSLPDDEGGFALTDPFNNRMDVFHYERRYHSPLVKNEEGIALERLDPWVRTDDPDNWRSAAAVRGTPGFRNSCRVDTVVSGSTFWVDPPVATAADVFVRIGYRLDREGWFAHARVFDLAGNEVKSLANGESLATTGFLRWDLDDDSGRPVWPGVYLAVVETYRLDGLRRLHRRRMVVTR